MSCYGYCLDFPPPPSPNLLNLPNLIRISRRRIPLFLLMMKQMLHLRLQPSTLMLPVLLMMYIPLSSTAHMVIIVVLTGLYGCFGNDVGVAWGFGCGLYAWGVDVAYAAALEGGMGC